MITENRIASLERELRTLRALLGQLAARHRVHDRDVAELWVEQAGHGFSVLHGVRRSGGTWVGATAAQGDDVGVVVAVDGDLFRVVLRGRVRFGSALLSVGETYYLATAAGALTTTKPSWSALAAAGQGHRPVGYAISPTELEVFGPGRQQVPGASWGDLQVVSPSHPSGIAMSPVGQTDDGFGTAWGITADTDSGIDISVARNVAPDVPGLHNDSDVELAIRLTDTGVAAGTYGGATSIPVLQIDAKGRVVAAGGTSFTAGASGPAGGDLAGTYPNPTVDGLQGTAVAATAPVLDQVLFFDGTTWKASFLLTAKGAMLVGNGTKHIQKTAGANYSIPVYDSSQSLGFLDCAAGAACSVFGRQANSAGPPAAIVSSADGDILARNSGALAWLSAGTACSLLGRSANSAGNLAPIAASADGQILARTGGALAFTASPQVIRGGVTYDICDVNTITNSTTPPSGAGKKGQMHLVY